MSSNCTDRRLSGIIRGTNFRISGIGPSVQGLVRSFQLRFQRKLSRIYDLASPSFYYVEGPPEGSLGLSQVVGPQGAPKLVCDCSSTTLVLDAGPTLCQISEGPLEAGQSPARYTLKNAMPFSLEGRGDSDQFLVTFDVGYLFDDIS